MATLLSYGFEPGDTATFSDTGTITVTDLAHSNSNHYSMSPGTSSYRSFTISTILGTTYYYRFYIYYSTAPTSSAQMVWLTQSSDGTAATIRLDANGRIRLHNRSGSSIGVGTLIDAKRYHLVELSLVQGSTSDAQTNFVFKVNGTVIDSGINLFSNTSGTPLNRVRTGCITATAIPGLRFDDIAVSDSDWIGPVSTTPIALPSRLATSTGTVFYVNGATGNDANSGSSASPWRTLQKAVETISPGQIIEVAAGTYSAPEIRTELSGIASAPKTMRAAPGAKVVTRSPNGTSEFRLLDVSFWRFERIEFDGSTMTDNVGVYHSGACRDIEWDRCRFYNSWESNVLSGFESERIHFLKCWSYSSGQRNEPTSNLDHGWYIGGKQHLLLNCVSALNPARGIQLYRRAHDSIISHCTFVSNGRAGIQIAGSGINDETSLGGYASQRNRVVNNISAYNEWGIRTAWPEDEPFGYDNLVWNNIVFNNSLGDYYNNGIASSVTFTPLDLGDDGIERVPNGDFETDVSGWTHQANVTVTRTRSTDWANTGVASMRMQWTEPEPSKNVGVRTLTGLDGMPIVGNQSIKVSAVVNVTLIPPNSDGTFVRCNYYDINGETIIGEEDNGSRQAGIGIKAFSETFMSPPGARYFTVGVSGHSGDGGSYDAYIDTVSVKFAPSPDPRFRAPQLGNVRIKSDSPAIGRADGNWTTIDDIRGVLRSVTNDIGAYEYPTEDYRVKIDGTFVQKQSKRRIQGVFVNTEGYRTARLG